MSKFVARRIDLAGRATGVAVATVLTVLALVVASAPQLQARLTAHALIMGGTFMAKPNKAWRDIVIDDFINPTVDDEVSPAQAASVYYPASAGIPPILSPTIDESVSIGVDNLEAAITAVPAGERIVAFGFSQSTVSTMLLKARLSAQKAAGEPVPDVTFVGIGVGNRPHGGITTRLQGVRIPIFGFTFNGPAPTDPEYGFETIDIAREYDGLADFPLYPLNLVATLNALFGVLSVHAIYQEVSLDPASPEYVPGTIEQRYGDTRYYLIPTPELPLFDPLRWLGVPEAVIDIVEPVIKVVVDAGYDRTIPFGEPTPLRLFPKLDRDAFVRDLFRAVAEGAGNAARLFFPSRGPDSAEPRAEEAVRDAVAVAGPAVDEPIDETAEFVVDENTAGKDDDADRVGEDVGGLAGRDAAAAPVQKRDQDGSSERRRPHRERATSQR